MANIPGVSPLAQPPSTNKKERSSGSDMDQDAFLKLLVTQMQYQDPLSPTDNTEYMSQLAQFSALSEMQNLNSSFSKTHASSLVGQYAIVKTTDTSGNVGFVGGKIDYIVMTNGKLKLGIKGAEYAYEELDSVVDAKYAEDMINNPDGTEKPEDPDGTEKPEKPEDPDGTEKPEKPETTP